MLLAKKNILVTGGAKRVGAQIVRHLAAEGARVIVHCCTARSEGEQLLSELPGSGHRLLQADLSIPGMAQRLFEEASPLDAIVNNASLYRHCGIYDRETAQLLHEINYKSPLALMELFRLSPPPSGGAVVNVLDQEILKEKYTDNAYLESRRKLMESTLEFARLYGHLDLRFNAVCPGPMLPPAELPHSKMEKTIAALPLKRRVEPADLAEAVLFLLKCGSVTGAVLPVDCGQHL